MTDLLFIPLKKTTDLDVGKSLKNLISSTYSSADKPENCDEAVAEFQKNRQLISKNMDKTEASLEVLGKYYDQIVSLEQKIPANDFQVPFKWKDAFDRGSIFGGRISLTVNSLSYEKVCVLFNIAALNTAIAQASNLTLEEGLQRANKKFQVAAGIFGFLKQSVVAAIDQEPTPDLEPDALAVMSALCLAQAQEMVVLKSIQDGMKVNIVAKLAAHADDLYADVLKSMQKEAVRTLWDKEWLPIISGKQALYNGVAQFHQAKVCNAAKAIGEEISRLQYAVELFNACGTRSGKSSLGSHVDWLKKSEKALAEASKDNDFIYHEKIPEVKALAVIGRAAVVKPTAVPEKFSPNSPELFGNLMPVHIHQAVAAYEVRRVEMVNGEVNKTKEATNLMNELLSSMNLPAGLEDTQGGGVPASIMEKSAAVNAAGGIQELEKLMRELPALLQRNTDILNENERLLQEEKQTDDSMRGQYKEKWTRTPSEKITETFMTNLGRYRTIIANATQADNVVKEKFETHGNWMRALEGGLTAITGVLPAGNGGGGGPAASRLKELMEEVETVKAERVVIESEIKTTNPEMKSVFLSAAASGELNEPVISAQSLGRVFTPFRNQVSENIEKQEKLIAEIQEQHQLFIGDKGGAGSTREDALKCLAAAHDAYMELKGNLTEGTKFYNDLTQLLITFQNKVSDFCFARRTEKEELLKDLTSGLASMSLDSAPTPPAHHTQDPNAKKQAPARPPPPNIGSSTRAGSTPSQQAPPSYSTPPTNPYAGAPAVPPPTYGASAPGAPQPAPQNPYAGAPQAQPNPYAGAPGAPPAPYGAAPAQPNPYGGAPATGALPYPTQQPGMPMPYQQYGSPMPGGFQPYAPYQQQPNPYAPPQANQQYPPQNYVYPPHGNPPAGYPQYQGYPQQGGYPQQSGYPPHGAPQGYPSQQGAPPQGYPSQQWKH